MTKYNFNALQEKITYLKTLNKKEPTLFADEIVKFINETSVHCDRGRAIKKAHKLTDILLSLIKTPPTPEKLRPIKSKLQHFHRKTEDLVEKLVLCKPLEPRYIIFGKGLLGVISALLTSITAIFETLLLPATACLYKTNYPLTKSLAKSTYNLFHSPINPALKIVEDLYEDIHTEMNEPGETSHLKLA